MLYDDFLKPFGSLPLKNLKELPQQWFEHTVIQVLRVDRFLLAALDSKPIVQDD